MKIDFKNQVVLITGATRGIGRQLADDFAQLGADLILTGTDKDQINRLNRQKKRSKQGSREYYVADFTDPGSTDVFINAITKYPRIDVCVNNAGINRINFIDETSDKDWKDLLAVNLEAPIMITRAVSKIMKKNEYGRIINITSIFGVISRAKRSIYTTTKFGLRGLTVTAAIELAPYNILVNSVAPGFVLTELTQKILRVDEMESLASQVPMGRFALPDEISRVVLFLASSQNTYLTGQNIVVDGGFVNV
ncbi:MAG TPA: SDR family oxidoreductase [Smithellaceae bacterium]|nr:SDR family oxidoreductase [Smithellaceae bacterium]